MENPSKHGQVGSNGLHGDQAGAAGHMNQQGGLLDGPAVQQAVLSGSPGGLTAFQYGQILFLLQKLKAQELGGGDDQNISHLSRQDPPQVLESKVNLLLTRSREADSM